MEYRHHYDEILEEGRIRDAVAIQRDLQLHDVNIASYYTDKYVIWLDFRTIDDNTLHRSGRRLENTSEGIRLQITKESGSAGKLFLLFVSIPGCSNLHSRCSNFNFTSTSLNVFIVQCLSMPRMLVRLNIYLEYLKPNIKIISNSQLLCVHQL